MACIAISDVTLPDMSESGLGDNFDLLDSESCSPSFCMSSILSLMLISYFAANKQYTDSCHKCCVQVLCL